MRRVYVKEEVCIGCHLCEVYCQLQHAQSKDIIKALKRGSSRPLSRLRVKEKGEVSFSMRCQQCDEAPCFYACITGAITRDGMTVSEVSGRGRQKGIPLQWRLAAQAQN